MARTHRYQSGEEVKAGDQITYAGVPGMVEFVAIDGVFDPVSEGQQGWPTDGFMINVPTAFGLIFLPNGEDEEDLSFVSRGPASASQDEPD